MTTPIMDHLDHLDHPKFSFKKNIFFRLFFAGLELCDESYLYTIQGFKQNFYKKNKFFCTDFGVVHLVHLVQTSNKEALR